MTPEWLPALLGAQIPSEGSTVSCFGRELVMHHGILRDLAVADPQQQQTAASFAFKWQQRETYSSRAVQEATRSWLVQRYGDWSSPEMWRRFGDVPVVLDAGCGAGMTARLLLREMICRVRYVGVDISLAVDVAAQEFGRQGFPGAFFQADLCALPLPKGAFDFILSEGVLHHTPSTQKALITLAEHLKPGGVLGFYVYARKAPVREFSDDLVRSKLATMSPPEAWEALMSLTRLGKALGNLNVTVDVPEDVELLGIPKGRTSIQRLIYWYFAKMYYRPEYTLEEMNHVNFDWFTPAYCHRQTPQEVQSWCEEAGLDVECVRVEEAGITVLAARRT